MQYPDPKVTHPMQGFPQVCFIKNTVTNPNIMLGQARMPIPQDGELYFGNF